MLKLDNKGWGMVTFVLLILILFGAVLLVAYLSNEYEDRIQSINQNNLSHYVFDAK